MHAIHLLGTSFYIFLFDLLRVRGSQRFFKKDTRHLFVLPTATWENPSWWKKPGDTAGHEVPHGYADFDHVVSVSFPDSTICLWTECPADTFRNSISGWRTLNPQRGPPAWFLEQLHSSGWVLGSFLFPDPTPMLTLMRTSPFCFHFPLFTLLLVGEATLKHGRDRQREHDAL